MTNKWDSFEKALDQTSPFICKWEPSTDEEKHWLSDKIALLVREGKPRDQAVAIAYSIGEKEFGKGGSGSGNFGHQGRPGEVGGSGAGGSGPETGGEPNAKKEADLRSKIKDALPEGSVHFRTRSLRAGGKVRVVEIAVSGKGSQYSSSSAGAVKNRLKGLGLRHTGSFLEGGVANLTGRHVHIFEMSKAMDDLAKKK